MESPLLNPATKKSLEAYLKQPGAPILLVGEPGSGKKFLARQISADLLHWPLDKLDGSAAFRQIQKLPSKQDIAISQVREIIKFLNLKSPGKSNVRRVVAIIDANEMNEEAQNALLKILEEPNSDTVFILTADTLNSLLPTITSRCQPIEIRPVSLDEAQKYFKEGPSRQLEEAWHLSQGKVGLLAALLSSQDTHELKSSVEQAKNFIKLKPYQRLIALDRISRDREKLLMFIDGLALVLAAVHKNLINKNQQLQQKRIMQDRKLLVKLKQYLEANTSNKLVIDELIQGLNI